MCSIMDVNEFDFIYNSIFYMIILLFLVNLYALK
jgi:hypothetical protein